MSPEKEMCGLKWGELYERFHNKAYNPTDVVEKVRELYESFYVKDKKGIYEYVLDYCQNTKLLNVRVSDEPNKESSFMPSRRLRQRRKE